MKKFKIIVFAVFVLLGSNSFSQSLLWKIEGNGMEKPSYIYGTIHAVCPDEIKITDVMKQAIKNVDKVMFELDFDEKDIQINMQKGTVMKDGKTLKDLVNKEEYDLVAKYFTDSLQIPFNRVHNMNPVFLGTMSWMGVLGCIPTSYEIELTNYTKSLDKEITGIESLTEQLGYFDMIPLKDQADYLVNSISNLEERNSEIKELDNAYKEQDLDKLFQITYKGLKKLKKGEYYLLELRNKSWVPRIDKLIRSKSHFIAVGAGHLGGDIGVLALLKQSGYKVTPISNE